MLYSFLHQCAFQDSIQTTLKPWFMLHALIELFMKLFKEQFNIIIWMSTRFPHGDPSTLCFLAVTKEVETQVLSETNFKWNQTGELIVFLH